MIMLYAMSCGDTVHDTYLAVFDEGLVKQLFLTIYMVLFFTAASNIFYAIMQEGYDKGRFAQQSQKEQIAPNDDLIKISDETKNNILDKKGY